MAIGSTAPASHPGPVRPGLSIGDLALLSDSRTAALLDREGTVVWYCPGRFDGPSAFGSLLDPAAGSWRLGPVVAARSERGYVPGSLVLRTQHTAAEGKISVTDFLALPPGGQGHELGRRTARALVRIVNGIRGRLPMRLALTPRFEYGITQPHLRPEGRAVIAWAGPFALRLTSDVPIVIADGRIEADFDIVAGAQVVFVLQDWDGADARTPELADGASLLRSTSDAWSSWLKTHEPYAGPASDLVQRSAIVLRGLTDARTGGVIAAPSTSLPAVIGGAENWDYRYVWLRDLAFVVHALWIAACPTEADRFLGFLAGSLGRLSGGHVPIVLRSDGARDLTEHTLDHLGGYRGSLPVRIGNDAWRQRQLDVLGELLDAAHLIRDSIESFSDAVRDLLVAFADRAARDWRQPDAGMWEARDQERHYTSSKVMCWVALDRGIRLATLLGAHVPLERWRRQREEVRAAILQEGWSTREEAFAGALGSDELDASVLLMPLVGFLPANDPRMRATVQALRERLTSGALVHRWDGDTNGFLLCSYWLSECEVLGGDHHAGQQRFQELNALANDLGLLSEMAEPGSGALVGNMPQALSHIGLVNASWRLRRGNEVDVPTGSVRLTTSPRRGRRLDRTGEDDGSS